MDKCVILYSSGLDSLVNLFILKDLWKLEPILLFINYNQKAVDLEFEMTNKIATKYDLKLVYKKLNLNVNSKLINDKSDINTDASDDREAPVDLVPYRNIMLAHQGILTAREFNAKYVAFGFNISEAGAYPDNTTRFLDALNNLYLSSTYYPYEPIIRFISGSIHFTKTELVMLGKYLNADFNLSASCYYPVNNKACGKCASCKFRIEAFKRANVKDLIEYNIPIEFDEKELDNNKLAELLSIINIQKNQVLGEYSYV